MISYFGLSYMIIVGEILFGLVCSQVVSLCGEIVDLVSYPRSRIAGLPVFWDQGMTYHFDIHARLEGFCQFLVCVCPSARSVCPSA